MAEIKHVRWNKPSPPTEEEAEALLHKEGYDSFRWHDVPGASYPRHLHAHDECLWVLRGTIVFHVRNQEFRLQPGDRLYLPSNTIHTAEVPTTGSVTYLVGQKRT